MNNFIRCSYLLSLFLFAMIPLHCASAQTNSPPGTVSNKDRNKFVETLLEKSSAVKQIESSGNSQAMQRLNDARTHFKQARQAQLRGDNKTADKLLIEATRIMFEAVRMANQKEVLEKKQLADFNTRLDSINALMEAHDRISSEKGKLTEGIQLNKVVSEKVLEAKTLLKNGHPQTARATLDEAYIAAKVAINTLRSGDTLVRSLHFESKQEEYRYEIDRNDTHQMLVKILSKKSNKNINMEKMIQSFMDKASGLRREAEQQASSGNFQTAIETLENSTKYIVRALRSSGIYIPG